MGVCRRCPLALFEWGEKSVGEAQAGCFEGFSRHLLGGLPLNHHVEGNDQAFFVVISRERCWKGGLPMLHLQNMGVVIHGCNVI